MTSRQLRNQRREAERKARKLAYQQSRAAAASAPETCGAGSLAGEPVARPAFASNPDLFDEFSAEEQAGMMAIRARVPARAGIPDLPQAPAEPKPKSGPTGPRTSHGKAISSGNSLKHGLASGRIIIPGEDPAAFEALLSDLIKEHAPANETESLLVQQMAQSWWLMQRAIRIQNQAFTETDVDTHKLALFMRYQTTYERSFYRALNTLLKLSRDRGERSSSALAPGVRSTSASAPQGAVSVRRKSHPEFVSQTPAHASPSRLKISVGQALSPVADMPPSAVSQ